MPPIAPSKLPLWVVGSKALLGDRNKKIKNGVKRITIDRIV